MAEKKEKFEIYTSKKNAHRLDFLLFPLVKSIHKLIYMWLIILKFKGQGQKMP